MILYKHYNINIGDKLRLFFIVLPWTDGVVDVAETGVTTAAVA